jgi:CDP-paratose 2-epimerase
VSLLELLDLMSDLLGSTPSYELAEWRTGDQRYYVSDTGKFQRATGWRPRITVPEGLERLHRWLVDSRPNDGVIATIGTGAARTRKAAGAER